MKSGQLAYSQFCALHALSESSGQLEIALKN